MHSFLAALAFLTVVPVRFTTLPAAPVLARSRYWYPVVGLLLGAALGGTVGLLVLAGVAPTAAAFLALTAWVAVTGALHLDGWCDLCDALFAERTPEDRLPILKDPHLGTFGLAGGVLLLLGKFVALGEFLRDDPGRAPWLVGLAVFAARCLVLLTAAGARYPREHGTGRVIVEATRWPEALLFAALALAAGVYLGAAVPLLLAVAATLALRRFCTRRLGGVTGDCLGATVELVELFLLFGSAVFPVASVTALVRLAGIP